MTRRTTAQSVAGRANWRLSIRLLAMALCASVTLLASVPAEEPVPTATPAPTPSPTATVTPAPTTAAPVRFIPPLSIAECQDLMRRAEKLIPPDGAPSPDPTWVAGLQSMVETCGNYLNFRSDLHTSLSQYRWIELGGGRVENNPGGVDKDAKTFDPPIEGISAISLEARSADVYLHRLVVFDEKNRKRQDFDFSTNPQLLRHALPRRDVYHLWRRSTVSRIEMEYSTVKEREPGEPRARVAVFAGITNRSRPEFVKTTIWHLHVAREEIGKRDWAKARMELIQANEVLDEYVRRNNPK
ncbi:hypothetical protein GC173_00940 [bacterium]|nr:hypothetical protein [bacterium]